MKAYFDLARWWNKLQYGRLEGATETYAIWYDKDGFD